MSQKSAELSRRQRALKKMSKATYLEIPRKHVLAALDMISTSSAQRSSDSSKQKKTKERCQSSSMSRRQLSINYQLFEAQRKAILHHDWDTAINYLYFMVDFFEFTRFSIRQFLLILFNHPRVSPDVITSFLNDALNLFSRSEQQTFLAHMFNLRSDSSLRNREEEFEVMLESDDEFEYE